MDDRSGLAALVRQAVADEPEQLPIADLLGLERVRPEDRPRERRVGRPPGALNKRTIAWRDYLLQRYTAPLETLARWQAMPTREMAELLGCELIEAARLQIDAAKGLASYLHERMPLGVQVSDRKVVILHIGEGAPGALDTADAPDAEVVEYQGVDDTPTAPVGQPPVGQKA